jgi:hypothetical protein
MDMKTWTKSAIRNYYLDPPIVFVDAEPSDAGGEPIAHAGYYVAPHCDPNCCQAIGGISKNDLGPFPTANAARKWSVKNLATID